MEFPAGIKKVSFSILVKNNVMLENDEDFTLMINSSSLPDYVNNFAQSTVTIKDDDGNSLIDIVFSGVKINGIHYIATCS